MTKLDFKITLRTFLKNKWYNYLNIAGLALGIAAFIFVMLYVDNETSYDRWNKNANRIFLVVMETPNGPSAYTPGKLASAIKNQCPEVDETGRINTALFQIPFFTKSGRFLIKKWVGADYSIAKILGIKPKGFNLDPHSVSPTMLLSKSTADVLFPGDQFAQNKIATMMSKSGIPLTIAGIAQTSPGNTYLDFDCIGFSGDITQGKDPSYATQIYQTFLLVKPHTDIKLLSTKIDKIYRQEVMSDTSLVAKLFVSETKKSTVYLDGLENLHLKPYYGSQVNSQIVNGLIAMAVIILIVTGINFTSLYISQASKRGKEVGIKKVVGVLKNRIAFQFMLEIFLQCIIALLVAILIVIIGLPYFNSLLDVNLLFSDINIRIVVQLVCALIALISLAGFYPSFIMSRFKPADVLRGDQFSQSGKFSWIRNGIAVLQFTFAITFIIGLIIINQQVRFMKSEDPGFNAKLVVYIDNLAIYNEPKKFETVRNRIKNIFGVENVTVASNIPSGIAPPSKEFDVMSRSYSLNTIGVDYEYFETLKIAVKEGRVFNSSFSDDSLNVVINESAAKAMNLTKPIGQIINGCGSNYKVVGVVKDVKAYGFEENIKPTIYLMTDKCGLSKTQIMIRVQEGAIPNMITTLNTQWRDINRLDGDNFNYHFLDASYAQLFLKEDQLQSVLVFFSVLAIFIASLGLFSLAAQSIRLRIREVAIRKVFGATPDQLILVFSKPFFYIVMVANIVAWPIAFIIAIKWLETFAYRIHLTFFPFIIALFSSIVIVFITVCLQVARAIKFNPSSKLR